MKVDYLVQNCKDKVQYLTEFMWKHQIAKEEIGYLGDDINDFSAMSLCSFVGCPADSCTEVKERADYVSTVKGGHGAVRDIIEHMLRERGEWEQITAELYGTGI